MMRLIGITIVSIFTLVLINCVGIISNSSNMDDKTEILLDNKLKRKIINPWKWQERFGFAQANDIGGFQRVVICSGQSSVDEEGMPIHQNDMRAQIGQSLDNLEVVLKEAGLDLSSVIRLNYYTTDVNRFFESYDVIVKRLEKADNKPSSTLLGVERLAFPELMVEIEATAVY